MAEAVADAEELALSTGETVPLPLHATGDLVGAVFAAPLDALRERLPDALEPIRVLPGRGAVALVAFSYDTVADGAIEPYDELAVVVAATHEDVRNWPLLTALVQGVSGYVEFLPVTHESARALGVDGWGYPKAVMDLAIDDTDGTRTLRASDDRGHLLTLSVERPPTVPWSVDGRSYTVRDGDVLAERVTYEGRLGTWPLGTATLELGDHPRAAWLETLSLGPRPLGRLGGTASVVIGPAEPVGPATPRDA